MGVPVSVDDDGFMQKPALEFRSSSAGPGRSRRRVNLAQRITSVYYTRVEEYAERWHASEGLLLGHLIAHEMGHLLLGANSHSGSGIMNVPRSRKKIERASLGTLLFTRQEATTMQDGHTEDGGTRSSSSMSAFAAAQLKSAPAVLSAAR